MALWRPNLGEVAGLLKVRAFQIEEDGHTAPRLDLPHLHGGSVGIVNRKAPAQPLSGFRHGICGPLLKARIAVCQSGYSVGDPVERLQQIDTGEKALDQSLRAGDSLLIVIRWIQR